MCLAEGAFCSTSPRSIRTTFHVEHEPPESFATRALMSTTFKTVKNELPDMPHTCSGCRNMTAHKRNPFPPPEWISKYQPMECFMCTRILFSHLCIHGSPSLLRGPLHLVMYPESPSERLTSSGLRSQRRYSYSGVWRCFKWNDLQMRSLWIRCSFAYRWSVLLKPRQWINHVSCKALSGQIFQRTVA